MKQHTSIIATLNRTDDLIVFETKRGKKSGQIQPYSKQFRIC